ncbi:TonB-dependent receptor domain-containing protein [Lutibacter citreus]|uniref:TonB-dependent receptor domain-containing protein n=1 Tax=Lutibacter citreus TaxID=2138210 RepID=UPI000DBE3998|nr:TonB-dependent receptor [Lutibacter citreus]
MRSIFLFLIILTPLLNFSQNSNDDYFTIKGKIIDSETKNPISDASIVFKNNDSSLIKYGALSNSKGNFNLSIKRDIYNAYISFIGYKTKQLNISDVSGNLNIGTIQLEIDDNFFDEIEIVAKKRAIEFKSNIIVYNVEKDLSSNGSSVSQILNNIPSVSVDSNGAITVQGQGNVQVMINGKTSALSNMSVLNTLPAGSVKKIDVITNPGSKYNASALSIINIELKKGKDEGLNASTTLTGGYNDYYGGLINFNYKTKGINFFTNTSYAHSNPIETSVSNTQYFENGINSSYLKENSEFNSKNNTFYTTIGSEFNLSKSSTLTTSFNYQNANHKSSTLTNSNIFNVNNIPISENNRNNSGDFENEILEFVVDFEHNFKKEGQNLTSYASYSSDNDLFNTNIINSNNNFTNEEFIEDNKLTNSIFDLTFTNPLGEYSTLTMGYYGEFEKTPFKRMGTENNNEINYKENIHAASIEYEFQNNKLYARAGLRGEFSETDVNYLSLGTLQNNHFNDVLPSFSFEYNLTEKSNINLSYGKLILRPNYQSLQPFEQKYSETSSYIGNPNLVPIYMDNSSLSYSYFGNKITIVPTLKFQRYKNYWQDVTYETGEKLDGVNKIITTPVGLGKVDYYGISTNIVYKPNPNLSLTGNILLINFDQTGTFKTVNSANETIVLDYNQANLNGSASLLTQLKIPNVFNVQLNTKHFLKSKGPYSTRKAYTYASAAINKDLFNKEASISLTIDDLFLSNKTDRDRFDTNYFSTSLIKNKYRKILLSFTYRFNQSKKDRNIDFNKKDIKPNY